MRLWALMLLLFWAGCTAPPVTEVPDAERPPPPIPVAIDPDLPECEQAAVVGAADWWSGAVGLQVFEPVPLTDVMAAAPPRGHVYVIEADPPEGAAGVTGIATDSRQRPTMAVIALRVPCELALVVAVHELGHTLGLGHGDAGTVMALAVPLMGWALLPQQLGWARSVAPNICLSGGACWR